MPQLKKGDVVRLKSGGPLMTIQECEEEGRYFCVWFSGDEPKYGTFSGEQLKLFKSSEEA